MSTDAAFQPDLSAIREHLGIFARLAGDTPCRLVLGGFGQNIDTGEKLTAIAESFVPTDADKMVDRVAAINAEPHRNVYLSTAIFRPDLEPGKKGGEADVLGVLAIVQDFDAKDMGDAAKEWAVRCPDGASMVLQTSGIPKPSFQVFYIFKRLVPLERAKAIAAALDRKTGADSCSKDMSHVWRIAGTDNKPNVGKIADGRPREPQRVYVSVPFHESRLWEPDDLERAVGRCADLAPAAGAKNAKPSKEAAKVKVDRAKVQPVTADDLRALGLAEEWIDKAGRVYADPKIKDEYPSRSEHQFGVTRAMVKAGIAPEVIYSVIMDKAWGVSESVREKGHAYAERQVQRSFSKEADASRKSNGGSGGRDLARLVKAQYPAPLIFHQSQWFEYHAGFYRPVETAAIRRAVYETAESAGVDISSRDVSDAMDGLEALCLIRKDRFAPPCWMDGRDEPKAAEVLVCANGLLHLPTLTLHEHDSDFLTFNALPYNYDPAATCPNWLKFLGDVYPDEADCITVTQEVFGYLLTGDGSAHKIIVVVGPPRSGKGTTARVLTAMVGRVNVTSPTLSQLGEKPFGRECLIGKRVAIIGDMQMTRNTDVAAVAETLKGVSGGDEQTIPRKYAGDWQGTLETRFVILTNEPPSITDASNALTERYIVLQMNQSFLGRENPHLTDELLAELPGILNWSIAGWRRLRDQRMRFSRVGSSEDMLEQIRRAQNPIGTFIADKCGFAHDPEQTRLFVPSEPPFVTKDDLYAAYTDWCRAQDMLPLKKELFCKQFIAATLGKAKPGRKRINGEQPYGFVGVRLLATVPDYSDVVPAAYRKGVT